MKNVRYRCVAAVFALACAASASHAAVLFVDANLATGSNDGSSWANAFRGRPGLVSALAVAADGDEVWIADGAYAPAPAGGSRDLSFIIPSGVRVLGGFAGGETSAEQRDPEVNVAILTGDLNSNDGPPQDGFPGNAQDNSRHVVRLIDAAADTLLDGLTIRAGYASGVGTILDDCGGNVSMEGGAPTLRRCVIENGYASWAGAGVAVLEASPTFEQCEFRACRADFRGSGAAILDDAVATFTDCLFDANFCGTGAGAYIGTLFFNAPDAIPGEAHFTRCDFRNAMGIISAPSGGGFMAARGVVRATDCTFVNNEVVGGGGAIYLQTSDAVIDRCDFVGNSAPGDGGGAIYIDGSGGFAGPETGPLFTNCRFVGNNGALVANFDGDVRLVNCTIANNSFNFGFLTWPTFFNGDSSAIALDNTIVSGNNTGGAFGPPGETLVGSGDYIVRRCLVQGWTDADVGDAFDADPFFVDSFGADDIQGTADDDVRLRAVSRALDAGDDALVPPSATTDLLGAARFIDGDGLGGAQVDLGAYEKPCAPDLVADGVVNFADLNALLGLFGLAAPGDPADIDGDGVVGFADLNLLLSAFGASC